MSKNLAIGWKNQKQHKNNPVWRYFSCNIGNSDIYSVIISGASFAVVPEQFDLLSW